MNQPTLPSRTNPMMAMDRYVANSTKNPGDGPLEAISANPNISNDIKTVIMIDICIHAARESLSIPNPIIPLMMAKPCVNNPSPVWYKPVKPMTATARPRTSPDITQAAIPWF